MNNRYGKVWTRRRYVKRRHMPLHRVRAGVYTTWNGTYTIMRHESDPSPKRWFVYQGSDEEPMNMGSGHTTLAAVTEWLARELER